MAANLDRAFREWIKRPDDQRFASLEELYDFTQKRKDYSYETVKSLDSIHLGATENGEISLNGNCEPANLSHWAFGQLCSRLKAPANYLRTLSPEMAKDCLQYGLQHSSEACKMLIRNTHTNSPNESNRIASAFTGPSYGRIWDSHVVESLMRSVEGSGWHIPRNAKSSDNRGLYASDRDMFAFMINGEKPIEVENAKLYRGFFCWNSETGSATFGLTTFLYNSMCDNHIVYGAEKIQDLRIIHRNQAPMRFYSQAIPILNRFVENQGFGEEIKSTVAMAMKQPIGKDLEETLDWFRNKPFTKKEITSAWENGLAAGEDVTTRWGMIQGLTSYAQSIPYIDKKVNLERRSGMLLEMNNNGSKI
ncbi:MAG: hypothetical protein R3F48_13480 [Candidatus Zixiibacteriota bacterium]